MGVNRFILYCQKRAYTIVSLKWRRYDGETVEAITENPYLQYFIGLHSFQENAPFHSSSMTHFRKRFSAEMINELNESIALDRLKRDDEEKKDDDDDDEPPHERGTSDEEPTPSNSADSRERVNQGKLLLDATCAPSDIAYPTDIGLLNKSH